MIIKCKSNDYNSVPKDYLAFAPDRTSEDSLAASIDKHYVVYAVRREKNTNASWYFVYTDSGYLWWMPSVAFEITDNDRPHGWIEKEVSDSDVLSSYPSLHQWKIEEGIIDGDNSAESTFLSEVASDKSFPSKQQLDELNIEFNKKQKIKKYEEELAIAKENGWERPEKPEYK
jgi:hypothetical protein